jgi:leucyl-tRNA synthetase
MQRYNPKDIEPKWQQKWAESKLYEVTEDPSKPKIYASPMLPYPSGTGLHTGHVRNYSITDAVARFHRQKGFNTMSNIAWDAFGLPAENFAIKTGTPPAESTAKNIAYFKQQLQRLGMSYDWNREFDTSDPSYYKWTQWVFSLMYKRGLAYKAEKKQWWCDKCNTVLADEQVINGKCWRHDGPDDAEVTKKSVNQWFFKITDYADEILESTDALNWPEKIKTMQKNWIGRKTGINITYEIDNASVNSSVTCFTTRPDTNFGATFIVIAPEHELAQKVASGDLSPTDSESHAKEVSEYINKSLKKGDLERQIEAKVKTGAFTGLYAVNQLTGRRMPIWVADFVLSGFGTAAVVGVPGHDIRDFEFAQAFNLPIVRVVRGKDGDESAITSRGQVQEEQGRMINSGFLDDMEIHEATHAIMQYMVEHKMGEYKVNYRIRDWLISRQRYWGAPVPIVYCPDHGEVLGPRGTTTGQAASRRKLCS